jgi:hypothetical protein
MAKGGPKDPMAAFAAPPRAGAPARPGIRGQVPGRPPPVEARRPITDDLPQPPGIDDDMGFETEPDYEDDTAFANFG